MKWPLRSCSGHLKGKFTGYSRCSTQNRPIGLEYRLTAYKNGIFIIPYRLPRNACSRSMASKSALKFPLPKDLAPRRWMISKNTVGRS